MKIWGLITVLMICSLCISETPQETVPPTTPSITSSTEPPTIAPPTTLAPDNPPSISGYNTNIIKKEIGNYELTFSNQPMQMELSVSATDDKGIVSVYAELNGQTIELEKDGSTYKALLDLDWFTKYDGNIIVEDTKGQTTEKDFTIDKTAADIIRVDWVGPGADEYDGGYSTTWTEDDMPTMTEQQFNDLQEDALRNPILYEKGAKLYNTADKEWFTLDKGAWDIIKDVESSLSSSPTAMEITEKIQKEIVNNYYTACAGNTSVMLPGMNYLFEKYDINARAMPMAASAGKSATTINSVSIIFHNVDESTTYRVSTSTPYIYMALDPVLRENMINIPHF